MKKIQLVLVLVLLSFLTFSQVKNINPLNVVVNYGSDVENVNPTTTTDVYQSDKLSIYPNPFNNILNINNLENIDQIVIINNIGQTIFNQKNYDNSVSINTTDFSKGNYIMILKYKNNVKYIHKIIKK